MTNDRRVHLFAFAVFLFALVAGTRPHWVGDGGEYLSMGLNLAHRGRPWIVQDDIPRLHEEIVDRAGLSWWEIEDSLHTARDGTFDFVHFWMYPALATPFVRAATLLGLNPLLGFTLLNLLLITTAFGVAWPRLGGWLSWLLLAGPALWWIDKAHTEVFTVSCLTLGVLLLTERPVIALVAIGAAATQNPPIVVMIPIAIAALAIARHPVVHTRRFARGVLIGTGVALLHPLYYQWRFGTMSLLLGATRAEFPSLRQIAAVPLDLDIGLLPSFPAFAVVIAIALVVVLRRDPRALARPESVLVVVSTAVFLVSFAKTTNMHHGATPGMSRYGVWLIPLAMPWLADLRRLGGPAPNGVVAAIAVCSVIACSLIFHPARPDNYRDPTAIAHWVWTTHPEWNNPLPEVFVESQVARVSTALPLATERCEKVLLIGRGDAQGMWPMPCFPAEIPDACRPAGTYCYANLTPDGYRFRLDPDQAGFIYAPDRVWPRQAEPAVRDLMARLQWEWWRMEVAPTPAHSLLKDEDGVDSTKTLESESRALIIVSGTTDGAALMIQPSVPMTGQVIDPVANGEIVSTLTIAVTGEPWRVPLPPGRRLLLIVLQGP